MHQSTDPVEYIYSISLFFKPNFKYIGLQDIIYSFDIAFTLILYFTLRESMCSGAVPFPQLYDPSVGQHFKKHLFKLMGSAGSCGAFPRLPATFVSWLHKKKNYTGSKDYMSFLNGPSNGVKRKGTQSWTKNFYGRKWPWQLTGGLENWTSGNWKTRPVATEKKMATVGSHLCLVQLSECEVTIRFTRAVWNCLKYSSCFLEC